MSGLGESAGERLRKDDEEGFRGRILFAATKSGERAGSLGWDTEGLVVVGKPRNWDVRSSNCFRRSVELESAFVSGQTFRHEDSIEHTSHRFPLWLPRPRRPPASDPVIWKCVHLESWAPD